MEKMDPQSHEWGYIGRKMVAEKLWVPIAGSRSDVINRSTCTQTKYVGLCAKYCERRGGPGSTGLLRLGPGNDSLSPAIRGRSIRSSSSFATVVVTPLYITTMSA